MRRAVLAVAALALVATPAAAQTPSTGSWNGNPRVYAIPTAIMNTIQAGLNRAGVTADKHPAIQKAVYDTMKNMLAPIGGTSGLSGVPSVGGACSYSTSTKTISCGGDTTTIAIWNNATTQGRTYRLTFDYTKGATNDGAGINLLTSTGYVRCGDLQPSGTCTWEFYAPSDQIRLEASTHYFRGTISNIRFVDLNPGAGAAANYLCATSPIISYLNILKCGNVPEPLQLGKAGFPLNFDKLGKTDDCKNVRYRLDAEGNLIIPAMPLAVGGPTGSWKARKPGQEIAVRTSGSWCVFTQRNQTGGCTPIDKFWATAGDPIAGPNAEMTQAVHRWTFHKLGMMMPERKDWVGALRQGSENCTTWASIAYRRPDGEIVRRQRYTGCGNVAFYGPFEVDACPAMGGSGDFHFYGKMRHDPANGQVYTGDCTWYAPRPEVTMTPDGYAINPETSVSLAELMNPDERPQHIGACPIDPGLLQKMAEIIRERVNIDDIPPVIPDDVKPGDTRVGDIFIDPPPTQPEIAEDVPPPPPPPVPPRDTVPGTTYDPAPDGQWKLGCMFGLGGCSAAPPGTPGTELPRNEEPGTGALQKLADWLPKFDGLTIGSANATCPTWALNLSSFGGSGWQWVIDSHCVLLASDTGNGTVASILGSLFLALWGLTAAMVILRA